MRKNRLFAISTMVILFFLPFSPVVIASEQENIDSFDVFPSNRWTENNVDYTATVQEGMLNVTDVGDGSADKYELTRGMRDLDGTIEIMFKVDSQDTNYTADFLNLILYAGADVNKFFGFFIQANADDDYLGTTIHWRDEDGSAYRTKSLTGAERCFDNVWYRLRIDYDILKSNIRIRCYFDNDTKVFDYSDFDLVFRPFLFEATELNLRLSVNSNYNTKQYYAWFDYVKAPFKEREWTNSDVPVGYLANNWFGCSAEDNIDDLSVWDLTIPYLDSVSGSLIGSCEDETALAIGEEMIVYFLIWAVDYDDGGTHVLLNIRLRLVNLPVFGLTAQCLVAINFVEKMNVSIPIEGGNFQPRIDFSFVTSNDRSVFGGNVEFNAWAPNNTGQYPEAMRHQSFSVDMSSVTTEASHEFFLQTAYDFDFDGDTEFYGFVRDLKTLERGIWENWQLTIADRVQGKTAPENIFTIVFRWLGGFIAAAFELVIGLLILALEAALGLIEVAIEALEPFLTVIQESIDALVGYIQAIAGEIITALGNAAQALLEAFFEALALLVDAVADLIFVFWNALSLPDILSVFDLLLVGFGQAIAGFGQFVTDINALIGHIFTLSVTGGLFVFFFLPITIAPTIGGWIEKVFQFLAFDITFGLSIFGFGARVPAGVVWIAIIIGSGILSGSILGGFF